MPLLRFMGRHVPLTITVAGVYLALIPACIARFIKHAYDISEKPEGVAGLLCRYYDAPIGYAISAFIVRAGWAIACIGLSAMYFLQVYRAVVRERNARLRAEVVNPSALIGAYSIWLLVRGIQRRLDPRHAKRPPDDA